MLENRSFLDFASASRAVLAFLHQRLGFDLWMVTRAEGDDWIILQTEDHGYGVKEGTVFRWADSFCSQMVQGRGPCIASRSADIPAYLAAPINQKVLIGAYAGVPLTRSDGTLFGTLCAIHPAPLPSGVISELPMINLMAKLLCGVLEQELSAEEQARRADRAQAEALTDARTGLYNRRGWDRLVSAEESRCQRHGHPACVVSINVDGLKKINDEQGREKGDELLMRTADAIRKTMRQQDIAARIGGDEFALLAVECVRAGAKSYCDRLREAISANGVEVSVGLGIRDSTMTISDALQMADQAMYQSKNQCQIIAALPANRTD